MARTRSLTPNRNGFTLVGVLMSAAIMAIVAAGFLKFQSQLNRAQGNSEKVNEILTIDSTIHTLLNNSSACKNSAVKLNFSAGYYNTLQSPGGIGFYDPNNKPVFVTGSTTNGVQVSSVQAYVYPPDGNVSMVRYDVKLTKQGPVGGGFATSYYANVALTGTVVTNCYTSNGQRSLTMVDNERINLPATSSAKSSVNLVANSAGPYPWGNCCDDHVVVPTLGCTATGATPTCPGLTGPAVPVTAVGNRFEYTAMVFGGPVLISGLYGSFGSGIAIWLYDPVGNVVDLSAVAAISYGTATAGFISPTFTSATHVVKVNKGTVYRFVMRGYLGYNDPAPSAAYSFGYGGADLHLTQYLADPP